MNNSTNLNNIWKKIRKTYYTALKEIQNDSTYNQYPSITLQCFSNCVAMLCHDDITLNIESRNKYLLRLMQLTGGPTVREHYCMWQAFGRGDSLRNMDNKEEINQFYIDPRLKPPGTWSYKEAYDFCLIHVFAEINSIHKLIYTVEQCFDDTQADLDSLNQLD